MKQLDLAERQAKAVDSPQVRKALETGDPELIRQATLHTISFSEIYDALTTCSKKESGLSREMYISLLEKVYTDVVLRLSAMGIDKFANDRP